MFEWINGHNLFIADSGESSLPPVVFLHGFPFSHEMWSGQIDLLRGRFRTVAFDFQGHGRSDIGDGQYTIEGHVDDLLAVLDRRALDRPVLAGLSMGGYVALRALERHHDRFRAAVLCDTRSEADSNEARVRRHVQMTMVKTAGAAEFADTFLKAIFAPSSFPRHPDAVAFIRNIITHTPPLGIAGTLLALAGRTDTTGALASIRIPTLILVGEEDMITPPAASRSMQERIAGSELHVIPGAAHMSNLENPERFNALLKEFLERVGR